MREIDSLRPPAAGRLLTIWRESRESAEDPLERTLLSNARVLAESCFFGGEPAFSDSGEVLEELTGRQMEQLLLQLTSPGTAAVNPGFDTARYLALREERDGLHS